MSEESKNFDPKDVFAELTGQVTYAVQVLRAGREALFESKIAKDFNNKIPRPILMHAIANALMECGTPNLDRAKFYRGVISLCLFFLEDDDVTLALKIKGDLYNTDKE